MGKDLWAMTRRDCGAGGMSIWTKMKSGSGLGVTDVKA